MPESRKDQTLSGVPRSDEHPLLSVWFEPGPTIMRLSTSDPRRLYFPLAAVWGASYNLSIALRSGVPPENLEGSSPWAIVGINLLFGALFGILVLWALSFLFAWLARVVGGRGTAMHVRTVLAWSSVPHIPNLAVAALVVIIGGTGVLTVGHSAEATGSVYLLRLFFLTVNFAFGMWGLVITVAGLRTVMAFSTLRAIGVLVFGGLLIFGLFFGSIIAFMTLARG